MMVKQYQSIFYGTAPFYSPKQASIILISVKSSYLYDYPEKLLVCCFKLFLITLFIYIIQLNIIIDSIK
jgi:hypothetical protein